MAYKENLIKKQHKLFYGSSYDRALDTLLFMWPEVLEKYPDAELQIAYGWDMFDKVAAGNPERQQWKQSVLNLMHQPGVIEHGRLGKKELSEVRKSCGIWAYPTHFPEINCITALDAQRDGLVPVTMDYAALSETVQAGVKIKGNIKDLQVQEKYLEALLEMMGNKERYLAESEMAKKFAEGFEWDKVAKEWEKEFSTPTKESLVSVITVTIRPGFWRIMAENLAKQTYQNFEWVIVDDYKDDRTKTAEKYAAEYGLKIRYLRGDKVLGTYKRRNGLARANNKGWQNAKGELLVYLQDFILIPENGIEKLVNLYNHHPNALLAPVDEYYYSVDPDRKNLEDWYHGQKDIITKFSWRNVRVQNVGLSKSDNPMDFEMNYGAIPRRIVKELNGWWEFFDEGLGYDNTEIAYRALERGYYILIDDTNIATCINLWPFIAGQPENIVGRDRHLATPYYLFLGKKMQEGLSPIRDENVDNLWKMQINVPQTVKDEDCAVWINDHLDEIMKEWK